MKKGCGMEKTHSKVPECINDNVFLRYDLLSGDQMIVTNAATVTNVRFI